MRTKAQLRRILELWEQGTSKTEISRLMNISYYSVNECIKEYGSVAGLEQKPPKARGYRTYSDHQFIEAVAASRSVREVLERIGIRPAGGNYSIAKRRIEDLGLSTAHFGGGQGWAKGKRLNRVPQTALKDLLVENSTYEKTHALKKRLINEGYFEAKCANCGLTEWRGQPISLELHHINGKRRDHRIENLSLLCPNCHAQTDTYRARNKKRQPKSRG